MASGQLKAGNIVDVFLAKVLAKFERSGWTVSKLAEESGVARPHLHRILAGTQQPNMITAEKIGKPLGISVRIDDSGKISSK